MDPIFSLDDERHYLGNLLAEDDDDCEENSIIRDPLPRTVEKPSMSFNVLEGLRKIANGSGTSLTKAEVSKLIDIVSDTRTRTVFNDVPVNYENFTKFIDSQPDIAAEYLLYILTENPTKLNLFLEILMALSLSVQTLITVNRFISRCEDMKYSIPNEFLHNFVSYCMSSCEQNQSNKTMINRLVRMVCVFFTTLLRLKNFDAKRRIPEMQSFATSFSVCKEAVLLYQATLQIK